MGVTKSIESSLNLRKNIMSAEMNLDTEILNWDIIHKLEQHSELIKALDMWVLIPDVTLLPKLVDLAKIVKALYDIPVKQKIYRGFTLDKVYQNDLDLKIKDIEIGKHLIYISKDKPLSFSLELAIAKAFGNIVVEADLDSSEILSLFLTPELNYIIAKRRRHKLIKTQHEVILLPPFSINLKIINYDKIPFWKHW